MPIRWRILTAFYPFTFPSWNPLRRLSGYEVYSAFGGNAFFSQDLSRPSAPTSAVVLGGYLGDSAIRLANLGYEVTVFEPVPVFAARIRQRIVDLNVHLEVLEYAASVTNEDIILEIDGDGTSQFSTASTGTRQVFKAVNFSQWIAESGQSIGLLEMNIEGAEYGILESIIADGSVFNIKILLVQFHNIAPESSSRRDEIRSGLSKTHRMEWCFDWVWEKWVLSDPSAPSKFPSNALPLT